MLLHDNYHNIHKLEGWVVILSENYEYYEYFVKSLVTIFKCTAYLFRKPM